MAGLAQKLYLGVVTPEPSTWIMTETARLEALLNQLTVRLKRSAVHDFRVTVKKLKAVLTATLSQHEYEGALPHLVQLNQWLGRYRDLQVIGTLLSSLPAWAAAPEARSLWQEKLAARKKKLRQSLSHPESLKAIMDEIRFIQNIPLPALHARHMASQPPQQETVWHDTRKAVKDQLYRNEASHSRGAAFREEQVHLYKVQHLIGHWHDWQIACLWIRKHRHQLPAGAYWPLLQQADMQLRRAAGSYRQFQ